jgi:hypothetical protein
MSRRLTIGEMRDIAKNRRGKCLSLKYVNNREKLRWQCSKGHIWEAIPDSIKHGHWCPYCAGLAKLTIEEMQELARQKKGKCLSKVYVNNKTKLKWQCSEKHIWDATPHKIKQGRWCPTCAIIKKKNTIKFA